MHSYRAASRSWWPTKRLVGRISSVCTHRTADIIRRIINTFTSYIQHLEQRLQRFEGKPFPKQELPPNDNFRQSLPNDLPLQSENTAVHFEEPPSLPHDASVASISASPEIFMGGKSGVSFTQMVLNAMNPGHAERLQSKSVSSPRDYQVAAPAANIFALPPNARDLLRMYFDFNHVLSPIFHLPTLWRSFEEVFSCDLTQRAEYTYTLAIMNMVFAIGTSHQRQGLDTSVSATRGYYETAMALVGPTLLFEWSIEKVQILLLGTRYLLSANYPDECWSLLGLAIRIAYGLELHRPPPQHLDCISKEVRKRVWYECFGLDKLMSMIYGRPPATSTATFTTPMPEDLDDDCIQPNRLLFPNTRTPSQMSFSLQVAKLYRILEAASGLNDPPLETLAQLDSSFEAWQADLPLQLRVEAKPGVRDDKALILAFRANMVRILIHRQSLASSLDGLMGARRAALSMSDSLRSNMLRSSRRICVRTAEDTIALVGQRHDRTVRATGPSWFNNYYCELLIIMLADPANLFSIQRHSHIGVSCC